MALLPELKFLIFVIDALKIALKSKPKCVILNTNKLVLSAEGKNGLASFVLSQLISNNYK